MTKTAWKPYLSGMATGGAVVSMTMALLHRWAPTSISMATVAFGVVCLVLALTALAIR